uniref:Uncharacterized protein n=1 Tax=Romanomermis culicivorax TaxID=13658 RepID=A0A915IU81_ROMCU
MARASGGSATAIHRRARTTGDWAEGEQLNVSLEDERNQNKILKKKHQAAVKDLKNELSLLKRRLDAYEAGTASVGSSFGADDPATGTVNSRSPSMTSLDVPGSTAKNRTGAETPSENNNNGSPSGRSRRNSKLIFDLVSKVAINLYEQFVLFLIYICCDHNQAMIEKIVKLQRMLARRSEKIEFLEEHVKQMTTEIQKKSSRLFSVQLAKKSNTVMGRIFRHTVTNNVNNGLSFAENYPRINDINDLSPELAVQIINKLQASTIMTAGGDSSFNLIRWAVFILNFILWKLLVMKFKRIIQLYVLREETGILTSENVDISKENIQTLGEEIANLSRENRTLKLDTAKR